jgi:hypothetical protein
MRSGAGAFFCRHVPRHVLTFTISIPGNSSSADSLKITYQSYVLRAFLSRNNEYRYGRAIRLDSMVLLGEYSSGVEKTARILPPK